MNKKTLGAIIISILLIGLMIQNTFAQAEDEVATEEDGGIADALPEILVALVGVAGLVILVTSTKGTGGAIGTGFNYVKAGFAFFTAAYLFTALAELGLVGGPEELIFEILSVIGMILIVMGPKKVADALKKF